MEAMHLAGQGLGVYSGISPDVDRGRGLFGRCDSLLGRRSGPFLLGSPLLAVVEAKDEDIPGPKALISDGPCLRIVPIAKKTARAS